jgi:hypothetical protein
MPFPFEVDFREIRANLDAYVDEVFACLESELLVMPKGPGFVGFPVFEGGYEALKRATRNFQDVTPDAIAPVVYETPIALIVLRCILGFTPPEWAYYATRHAAVEIGQGAARTIDRRIRMHPTTPLRRTGGVTDVRIGALIEAAILQAGAPEVPKDRLHRLDKADTAGGLVGIRAFADLGAPYSVLFYERFLGRPSPDTATPLASWWGTSLRTPSKTCSPTRGSAIARRSAPSDCRASTRRRTLWCPTRSILRS